ncbi:YihY/virulence factor BrkB family protein [Natronomonas salina]|uniref:YihY/virulence factor BrkB family protein n=1 Tax=Natronomonas salina TaxID=1710540 RepID=UPI001FEA67BD|nr:YihY/virulence factor BrkB family protein [Natronomonas salina]
MLSNTIRTAKQVGTEFSEKNVTFMAAGIAYNAFISLAPLLLVLLVALSLLGGGLEQRIIEMANSGLPGPIADVVADVFEDGDGASGASAIGLVVLVWGTLKIFRGLDTAFSEIYETTGENSFVDQIVDGLVVGAAILVAVFATVGVTAVFARLEGIIPYIGAVTPLVLVAGLVVAFFPMYYRFPDVDLTWRSVLPGVVFAAVGWAVFQSLFQVYLQFSGGDSGSFFGGVVVVITWLYFSGLVLLLGAVINAVVGDHSSGRAGGVGQSATSYQTERETELSRREVSEYLETLREDLVGGPRGARRREEDGGHRPYPLPADRVTVVEQSRRDGDDDAYSVSLRWDGAEERTGDRGRSSPEDADEPWWAAGRSSPGDD